MGFVQVVNCLFLFLGYFVHIIRRERDGIISKDLYWGKVLF